MIRIIFICQAICLAGAFIYVALTGANVYSELGLIGKIACILILVGFVIEFGIVIAGFFKKK